jgi:hypothetical protein
MKRSVDLFLGLIAALATALLLGMIAHGAMGMSIDMIRIDALGAAGLIFGGGYRRIRAEAEKVKQPNVAAKGGAEAARHLHAAVDRGLARGNRCEGRILHP